MEDRQKDDSTCKVLLRKSFLPPRALPRHEKVDFTTAESDVAIFHPLDQKARARAGAL